MNDAGREKLVAAALDGTPQVQEAWSDGRGGFCAQGIFLREVAPDIQWMVRPSCMPGEFKFRIMERYEITEAEWRELQERNDRGEDFLTIARKVGNPE